MDWGSLEAQREALRKAISLLQAKISDFELILFSLPDSNFQLADLYASINKSSRGYSELYFS
jgi:hypothetical protein